MSNFWKAFMITMITAVPIIVLSVVSAVGYTSALARAGDEYGFYTFLFLWFVPAALWVIALVAAIVFTFIGKKQIAVGIWAGVGIGIVSLGVTCFAMVSI